MVLISNEASFLQTLIQTCPFSPSIPFKAMKTDFYESIFLSQCNSLICSLFVWCSTSYYIHVCDEYIRC